MNKLGLIVAMMVAIVLIILAVWRSGAPTSPPLTPPIDGTAMAAPDAGSVTLGGQKWRLQDQRGKVVFLDFWATWCAPCVASIPEIKEIHEKFKDNPDFLLVGVSWDDEKSALESFVQKRDIKWLQLFDMAGDNEMVRKFGISRIPTTFLIDRKGNIAAKDLSAGEMIKEIERLLKTPA